MLAVAGSAIAQQAPPLADMALGSIDAKVEIIEYASMSCSHCAQFHTEVLPTLKTKYVDTGKVRYIFREFPLNLPAFQAAILARCAGPERFFSFVDVLFREQQRWAGAGDTLNELKQIARLGGVPPERYDECLNDKKITEGIFQVRFIGEQELKVNSTPSFVIGGKLYTGSQTVAALETAIDALLKGGPTPGANAGPASRLPGSNSPVPPYLIVVVLVVIVGGIGIFLLRRKSQSAPPSKS